MQYLKSLLLIGALLLWNVNLNAQQKMITFKELPAPAQQFVNTHFNAQDVLSIEEEAKAMGGIDEYELKFKNGTKVEFDASGNWKEVEAKQSMVPHAIVPEKIISYVQQNYAEQHVTEIKKKKNNYSVEITSGIELKFNEAGEFQKVAN